MICPKCDGKLDTALLAHWGDNAPQRPANCAPFICGHCGSFLVLSYADSQLYDVAGDPALMTLLQSNQALWKAINEAREKVLSLPSRKPVLR